MLISIQSSLSLEWRIDSLASVNEMRDGECDRVVVAQVIVAVVVV
jgi:hypothetical protein